MIVYWGVQQQHGRIVSRHLSDGFAKFMTLSASIGCKDHGMRSGKGWFTSALSPMQDRKCLALITMMHAHRFHTE